MNPHRSPLGLGNYDVNVMIAALQLRNLQVVWFDKRKPITTIEPSKAVGFIMNVPRSSSMTSWLPSSIFSLKHWIALKRIGQELYFNLDSHFSEPKVIGNEQDFIAFLQSEMGQDDRQLLIVQEEESHNLTEDQRQL